MEKHPVALPQLQLQHLVDHILILPQGGIGGRLHPLIPVLAAHEQRDLLPGIDAGEFARHLIQHAHQSVEDEGAAHLVQLAVGSGHGRRQGQTGTQLAFDGGLGHGSVERLRDSLPRYRPDHHTQPVLVQHEVVVKVVLYLPAPA